MFIARKKLQLQRLWRQRACRVTTYIAVAVLVLLGIVYNKNEVNNYEMRDTESGWYKFDKLESKNQELPGGPDPHTVFSEDELGNYEPREPEIPSSQPGEHGKPVRVEDEEGKAASRLAENEFGFNTYVSDMISMNRTIPDIRPKECKNWNYPEKLPTVSVVIVFHNEGWTPLLRTVHSVLLRSPPELIHEIVMVDDYSEKQHLKEKLDKYVTRFNGKVIIVRTEQREGLINARTIGAKHSTGDVVLFLDAHCEVNTNWLPPLLAPIKYNRKVMSVPVIDGIDSNTWEYRSVYGSPNSHHSGIFEWGLLYKETEITERESKNRKYDSQPFRSPTHAGGLFAIDRLWFEELGYYDEGLQIWGGEQYELSFKIWQCGGGIVFVPCSHVGHVYRSHMPYTFGKLSGKPVISINMMRVVKTWMDDYSTYYLTREPQAAKVDPGDISKQLALRDRLQCKSFKWYMDNVAYDVLTSYPILPQNLVWGSARNPATGKCLDRMGGIPGPLGASQCHNYGGNQLLRINMEGQFAQGEWCLTGTSANKIIANHCKKGTVDGQFTYDRESQHIVHKTKRRCITVSANDPNVNLLPCSPDNELQKFVWKEFYQSN